MKVAVLGSRSISIDHLERFLPADTTEIVSGGAQGIDTCARKYALSTGLHLTEFFPEYARYCRAAPLKRSPQIIDYADEVLLFWDGASRGTKYTIELCRKSGKPFRVFDAGGRRLE